MLQILFEHRESSHQQFTYTLYYALIANTSHRYSPEDHGAVLPVKGEVVDSDGAGAAVDGRRQPVHTAVRRHQSIAVKCYLELPVHTVHKLEQMDRCIQTHRRCFYIAHTVLTVCTHTFFYIIISFISYKQGVPTGLLISHQQQTNKIH